MGWPIRATSINSLSGGKNYQIDHSGLVENVILSFEKWCVTNDALWGRLFSEATGFELASYDREKGIYNTLLKGESDDRRSKTNNMA